MPEGAGVAESRQALFLDRGNMGVRPANLNHTAMAGFILQAIDGTGGSGGVIVGVVAVARRTDAFDVVAETAWALEFSPRKTFAAIVEFDAHAIVKSARVGAIPPFNRRGAVEGLEVAHIGVNSDVPKISRVGF